MVKNNLDKVQRKVVKPFVDLILGRTMSKKLTVWIVACVALWQGLITGAQWVFISMFYIIGLAYLNHLQEMAKARKEVNDFRGADQIKIIPGLEDNENYD